MFRRLTFLLLIALLNLPIHFSNAQELPKRVKEGAFSALKNQSPFTRVLDLSEAYSLRGVAQIGNQAVARLYDRTSKKTITVTQSEVNRLGMTLVDVTHNPQNLEGVSVRIAVGSEEVDLYYDTAQITREAKPKQEYKKDSRGNPIPPKALIDNYRSMNRDQHQKYREWRSRYYSKNPKMENSAKRFPVVEKAINAIKAGKTPPKP